MLAGTGMSTVAYRRGHPPDTAWTAAVGVVHAIYLSAATGDNTPRFSWRAARQLNTQLEPLVDTCGKPAADDMVLVASLTVAGARQSKGIISHKFLRGGKQN